MFPLNAGRNVSARFNVSAVPAVETLDPLPFTFVFMTDVQNYTLPVWLGSFRTSFGTDWGATKAASTLFTLPVALAGGAPALLLLYFLKPLYAHSLPAIVGAGTAGGGVETGCLYSGAGAPNSRRRIHQ